MLNPVIANLKEVGLNLGSFKVIMPTPIVLLALCILGIAKTYNYTQADEAKHITNAQVAKCTAATLAIATVAGLSLLVLLNKGPLNDQLAQGLLQD